MKIKILDGKLPSKSYEGDAGYDVYAKDREIIWPNETKQIKLGICVEIDPQEVIIMSERSGMAIKHNITSIGNVIDSNYRGEISIILHNLNHKKYLIEKGDKIGQILILKLGNQEIECVEELSTSERGEKAHFSSGK